MTSWELAGAMSDVCFQRIVDDLARVPLLEEALIEAYSDGRWLYEACCWGCGIHLERRRPGCLTCTNRHEKRRQRDGVARPAPVPDRVRDERGRFRSAA